MRKPSKKIIMSDEGGVDEPYFMSTDTTSINIPSTFDVAVMNHLTVPPQPARVEVGFSVAGGGDPDAPKLWDPTDGLWKSAFGAFTSIANGLVQVKIKGGVTGQSYKVVARVNHAKNSPITFSATTVQPDLSATVDSLVMVSGDGQAALAGNLFAIELGVRALNTLTGPVPHATVTFQVITGHAAFIGTATVLTSSGVNAGLAVVSLKASAAEPVTVRATCNGHFYDFHLSVIALDTKLEVVGITDDTPLMISGGSTKAFHVRAYDAHGGVPGVPLDATIVTKDSVFSFDNAEKTSAHAQTNETGYADFPDIAANKNINGLAVAAEIIVVCKIVPASTKRVNLVFSPS